MKVSNSKHFIKTKVQKKMALAVEPADENTSQANKPKIYSTFYGRDSNHEKYLQELKNIWETRANLLMLSFFYFAMNSIRYNSGTFEQSCSFKCHTPTYRKGNWQCYGTRSSPSRRQIAALRCACAWAGKQVKYFINILIKL